LQIELEEEQELILENAMPMYDDVGMLQDSFDFRLVNYGKQGANYVVKLADITTDEKLDTSIVKYGLTKEEQNRINYLSSIEDSVIDVGFIKENQIIHYSLRLWIDSSVEDEELIKDKSLKYRIEVELSNAEEIELDLAGGTSEETKSYIVHDQYTSLPAPTKEGYNFLGWYDEKDNLIVEGTPVTYKNNKLAAKWAVVTYTLTFNPNGGVVNPTNKQIEYGSTYGSLPTPTKTYYKFLGWYDESNQLVSENTKVSNKNHQLTAQWERTTYTVTFNANGGTVSPTSKLVENKSTYGSLPTPTKTSNKFLGWYTSLTGGTQIASTTIVNLTANQTVYAHWTADPNSSISSPGLIDAIGNNNFANGNYQFSVNNENYATHIYNFDGSQHWTTNQTFGNNSDVGSTNTNASRMVIVKVNGDLVIDNGVVITAYDAGYGGPKGLLLYVTGKLINNGTITMTEKGAKSSGENVYLVKKSDGNYEYVPKEGGAGAANSDLTPSPNYQTAKRKQGTAGNNRGTGGGSSGSASAINAYIRASGGKGATGTSYSGGAGGGGSSTNCDSYHCSKHIQYGGDGTNFAGGIGAVNDKNGMTYAKADNGAFPGGGLLIIYCNVLQNEGTITSYGKQGEGSTAAYKSNNYYYANSRGGDSGGGSINIFYRQNNSSKGEVSANLSTLISGAGTVTYTQLP